MKTYKLYYEDAYIKSFSATVRSVERCDEGFWVELDRTAFFPEEGGQSSDSGYIADARVNAVEENSGVIRHLCDKEVALGECVSCSIDFSLRFEKMQCHTAEHIVCGLFHKLYGYENVGFHLGGDYVTFDINAYVDREVLDKIELLANEAIFANAAVKSYFPTEDELSALNYRSKTDIIGDVRIVEICGYDICACCAPHVRSTSEIGLIKLLDSEKHRGGTRIYLQAGIRALMDYRRKYSSVKKISELTCTPQGEVDSAVEKMRADLEKTKCELKLSKIRYAEHLGRSESFSSLNPVRLFDDFSIDELREYSNFAVQKAEGVLVALSGNDGDYKFVISSKTVDLKKYVADFKQSLSAKGGGKSEMLQGTFSASYTDIEEYFKNKEFV